MRAAQKKRPKIGGLWKVKHIFKSEFPICQKRKVFDQCVLPVSVLN